MISEVKTLHLKGGSLDSSDFQLINLLYPPLWQAMILLILGFFLIALRAYLVYRKIMYSNSNNRILQFLMLFFRIASPESIEMSLTQVSKNSLDKATKWLIKPADGGSNLSLKNDNCLVNLRVENIKTPQIQCFAKDKNGCTKFFIAVSDDFVKTDLAEVFDLICDSFGDLTFYADVKDQCAIARLIITERSYGGGKSESSTETETQSQNVGDGGNGKACDVINLNTATSTQLADLPGVNIVLAKKIINEREKKPFASFEDFLSRIEIKRIFVDKIKALVRVSSLEELKKSTQQDERIIDI